MSVTKEQFAEALKERTKLFVLNVIQFYLRLPKNKHSKILGKELVRSATSIAASYRMVCSTTTDEDFTATLKNTVKEAEESLNWISQLSEFEIAKPSSYLHIQNENLIILAELIKLSALTK